jgi:hypothetical protein
VTGDHVDFLKYIALGSWHYDWALVFLPVPFLFSILLDAVAWRELLGKTIRVPFAALAGIHAGAEAVVMSIPGGFAVSDAIKVVFLQKRYKVPATNTISALVVRHWLLCITQILYILLMCALAWMLFGNRMSGLFGNDHALLLTGGAVVVVFVCAIAVLRLLFRGELARWLWNVAAALPIPALRRRLDQSFHAFEEADAVLSELGRTRKKSLVIALFVFMIGWTMESCETILLAHVIALPMGWMELLIIEALLSMLKIAAFFLPSGVGAKDAGYFALFTSFGMIGVQPLATVFVVLKRLLMMVFIGIGYVFLVLYGMHSMLRRSSILPSFAKG